MTTSSRASRLTSPTVDVPVIGAAADGQEAPAPVLNGSSAAVADSLPLASGRDGYVIPLVGVRLPGDLVEAGFWGALAGGALFGVVDAPLALLVAAAVVVARRRGR